MIRWMSATAALCAMFGCTDGPSETVLQPSSPEAFVGAWRSVTPTLEFIRLSVHSKSSEMGVLGARLTFSGVAWEGGGRIEGDSLVADMSIVGAAISSRVLVAHASDARTLQVTLRPASSPGIALTLVRDP